MAPSLAARCLPLALSAVALAGPAAVAQEADVGPREQAYAEALSDGLDRPARAEAVDERRLYPKHRGVRVVLPGLEVERLRFADADEARIYLGGRSNEWTLDGEGASLRHVIEQRGRQVLVASGPALADASLRERVRELGWSVLPHPTHDAEGAPYVVRGVEEEGYRAYRVRVTTRAAPHVVEGPLDEDGRFTARLPEGPAKVEVLIGRGPDDVTWVRRDVDVPEDGGQTVVPARAYRTHEAVFGADDRGETDGLVDGLR